MAILRVFTLSTYENSTKTNVAVGQTKGRRNDGTVSMGRRAGIGPWRRHNQTTGHCLPGRRDATTGQDHPGCNKEDVYVLKKLKHINSAVEFNDKKRLSAQLICHCKRRRDLSAVGHFRWPAFRIQHDDGTRLLH